MSDEVRERKHVYPLGDLRDHVFEGCECWCDPLETRDDKGVPVIVHNSADGREDYETGRRKRH